MLRIDIAKLSQAELKRLLAAARARGQDGFADQLEAELGARAAGSQSRPAPAPLADPESAEDETWPMVAPHDTRDLYLQPAGHRRSSVRRWPLALAAAGVLGIGAGAWVLNGAPGAPERMSSPAAPAAQPPQAPRAMAARAGPSELPPAVARSPGPESAPDKAAAAAPPQEAQPAPRPPSLALAKAEAPVSRRLDPCARPPTPADRLLCNDLALNLLDHEMREAYGRAVDAGADPAALRRSQDAWRRARDPTADPRALAELYDRRILDLKASAAPPPPTVPAEISGTTAEPPRD